MKKLKNIHPLKEIVVHGQCITIGFMLTISHIGAANPISFVSADIPLPRPVFVKAGKYHGKIRRRKNFSKNMEKRSDLLSNNYWKNKPDKGTK